MSVAKYKNRLTGEWEELMNGVDGNPGNDGFSPTIQVTEITGGHRLTITDINSTKVVDVMDGTGGSGGGENGKDGRGIVSVKRTSGNGTAGTTDTYTITYTDNTTSTFTVYNGKDGVNGQNGKDGSNGKDGYTPVKGIDYFDGNDGKDGVNGKDGQDGYTPVKGIDYFDGKDGQDGYTPVKGVDYFDGANGEAGEDGKNADVYVLIGHMNKVKNGSVSLNLYKNGQSCTETLYLRSLVSSGGTEWREHGTSTGSFKTSKSWSFGGTDAGMAWRCEIYSDSTKANLLASCFIYGGATGATGAAGKDGTDYVLTDADKAEIAEQAAALVPSGGNAPGLMIVTYDRGRLTASNTSEEIYNHVQNGGTVMLENENGDLLALTACNAYYARFSFIDCEAMYIEQYCVLETADVEIYSW